MPLWLAFARYFQHCEQRLRRELSGTFIATDSFTKRRCRGTTKVALPYLMAGLLTTLLSPSGRSPMEPSVSTTCCSARRFSASSRGTLPPSRQMRHHFLKWLVVTLSPFRRLILAPEAGGRRSC